MIPVVKVLLIALLAALSANIVFTVAKTERVRVIDIKEEFTLRYPRVYLWLCIVFFTLVAVLALDMIVWRRAAPAELVPTCALAAIGVPFFLLSVVWKIKVREEYIIYVNALGVKKQIYYKDISRAVVTRNTLFLHTTLKNYRMNRNVVYREYFLKRLSMNGVEIERYD